MVTVAEVYVPSGIDPELHSSAVLCTCVRSTISGVPTALATCHRFGSA